MLLIVNKWYHYSLYSRLFLQKMYNLLHFKITKYFFFFLITLTRKWNLLVTLFFFSYLITINYKKEKYRKMQFSFPLYQSSDTLYMTYFYFKNAFYVHKIYTLLHFWIYGKSLTKENKALLKTWRVFKKWPKNRRAFRNWSYHFFVDQKKTPFTIFLWVTKVSWFFNFFYKK